MLDTSSRHPLPTGHMVSLDREPASELVRHVAPDGLADRCLAHRWPSLWEWPFTVSRVAATLPIARLSCRAFWASGGQPYTSLFVGKNLGANPTWDASGSRNSGPSASAAQQAPSVISRWFRQ
jgi:hypothetical protein